jgi:hypothetical protein
MQPKEGMMFNLLVKATSSLEAALCAIFSSTPSCSLARFSNWQSAVRPIKGVCNKDFGRRFAMPEPMRFFCCCSPAPEEVSGLLLSTWQQTRQGQGTNENGGVQWGFTLALLVVVREADEADAAVAAQQEDLGKPLRTREREDKVCTIYQEGCEDISRRVAQNAAGAPQGRY